MDVLQATVEEIPPLVTVNINRPLVALEQSVELMDKPLHEHGVSFLFERKNDYS